MSNTGNIENTQQEFVKKGGNEMVLITEAIKKNIPKLRAQSETGMNDLIFYVKLSTTWAGMIWYIAEADFETGECFGLVEGFERELVSFNLNEIMKIKESAGLKIEMDPYFSPLKYTEIVKSAYQG